jgi:16S rRNA (uracil1498-N3)-methyltransferase
MERPGLLFSSTKSEHECIGSDKTGFTRVYMDRKRILKKPRFFCRPIIAPAVRLSEDESRHARSVMRLAAGDEVELFDGDGTVGQGRIGAVDKKGVEVEILDSRVYLPATTGRIVIAASVAKGERFDGMVTQCTELGVDHIVPVIYERTVKLASGHQPQRYERLAIAACKQSGRVFLPILSPPVSFVSALDQLRGRYPNAAILFGSLVGQGWNPGVIAAHQDVIAFVGPEGGFTSEEESLFAQRGAMPIRLTDTTLRVETAALALAALLAVKRLKATHDM